MKSKISEWTNYEIQPAFILGFHGCDAAVGEAILRGETPHLKPSKNDYDWLVSGIYFWEGNPARALQFAYQCAQGSLSSKGTIKIPFVLGAIINLGHCLDLADSSAIEQVKEAYQNLLGMAKRDKVELPHPRIHNGIDIEAMKLNCLVFNSLHASRNAAKLSPYDTVRGLFLEGNPIYPGAQVNEDNHIQICVCNPANILGYFRPIQ